MPIKFIVEIDNNKGGIRVETPASVASPDEIRVGLLFKKKFDEFCKELGGETTSWRKPNNENLGDN